MPDSLPELLDSRSRLLQQLSQLGDFQPGSIATVTRRCGKPNCHCHTAGTKHGPFFYLNRCFAKGQVQSLLLKTPNQVEQARQSLAAYAQLQEHLDQISQINHELLRRGAPLVDAAR